MRSAARGQRRSSSRSGSASKAAQLARSSPCSQRSGDRAASSWLAGGRSRPACRSRPARPRCRGCRRRPGTPGRGGRRSRRARRPGAAARRRGRRRAPRRSRAARRSCRPPSRGTRRRDVVASSKAMSSAWPAIISPSPSGSAATRRAAAARPGVEQHLHGERQQRVADDDAVADAEHGPHRRAVAALAVVVDDVVVHQREVVDQLDGDRAGHADRLVGAARAAAEQSASAGADALAAAALDRAAVDVDPAEVVLGGAAQPRRRGGPTAARMAGWIVAARASEDGRGGRRHAAPPRCRGGMVAPSGLGRRRPAAAHGALHRGGPAGGGPRPGQVRGRGSPSRAGARWPAVPGTPGTSPPARGTRWRRPRWAPPRPGSRAATASVDPRRRSCSPLVDQSSSAADSETARHWPGPRSPAWRCGRTRTAPASRRRRRRAGRSPAGRTRGGR